MSTATTATMTADEFYDFCHRPENRDRIFELEQGRVVEMSRPGEIHGLACANVIFLLGAYVRQRRKGYVCANDTGVIWERDPDTVRGPDAFLYERSRPYDELKRKYNDEVPQLLVEVLSPNDRSNKTLRRVEGFLRKGTAVVWVIDPEDRTVSVHHLDQFPRIYDETDELTGEPAFPDLRVRVADLFFVPEG